MKKTLIILVVVVVLVAAVWLIVVSCKSEDGLSGTFILKSQNGIAVSPAITATISFSQEEQTVDDAVQIVYRLSAEFCNILNASYSIEEGRLITPGLMGTKKACLEPAGLEQMEADFQLLLSENSNIVVDGKTLTISNGNRSFVFEK
jgi:Heat shock protein